MQISTFYRQQSITNVPLNRFPRPAYTLLRNDVEIDIQNDQSTGLINWAKGMKECLDSCGFYDVWLKGRVADKSAFHIYHLKQKNKAL